MMIESALYDKLGDGGKVKCDICNHHCVIGENELGFCLTRENRGGKLYNLSYSSVSSVNVDPIEKKPLYHFLPGSFTYSVGGFSCNMRCLNCQNYTISQNFDVNNEAIEILPETIVKIAIDSNCKSIAWTYNEPTMYLEYVVETAIASKKYGLKNVYVSNGNMSDESLKLLLPHIDAFNIDLKSMSNNFYRKICKGTLEPILDNLKKIYKNKKHLEITNLLINGFNDSSDLIKELVDFVAIELGVEVPVHFSRFFPYYKMSDASPTDVQTLKKAREIAIDAGLENVYLGNTQSNQNSYCPNCGELLIRRDGYDTLDEDKIKDDRCVNCNLKLNFYL